MTDTAVTEVHDRKVSLSNGQTLDFGLMVWSGGNRQIPLVRELQLVSKFLWVLED